MSASSSPPPTRFAPHGLRWPQRLARFAVLEGSRRRTLAALAGASIGDFFVPALPTQTSVIVLGLLQPQRAPWVALAFASAAAMGAAILAALLALVSGYATQFGTTQLGDAWLAVAANARDYGFWAVLLASIFPTPPRLLTAATLLAGAGVLPVVAGVFAGKLIWFTAFLLLLTRAPRVMTRIPILGKAVSRLERFRAGVLHAHAMGR